ncbi:lipopolysaccharide heptosyltransferase I [Pseudohongiella spirulinae]|uniref:Lipopolysaccharide heptosyltransferase 1 n=1 Tax=Pseudohongiella spirulinae TaxID=1249552 RepID=A0A0S2KAB7_9GAMM|nr:lipopolysaccharide heptosyltransferase I [Pseudohongiella spirulinae]ALO44996.1 Heptosyltransferase I [Pseudohongiella spirulinae]
MRILIVKTSSLGDVIHTLPALTDACQAIPGLQADWVVEEAFVEIPALHPSVGRVIPVSIRRWRREGSGSLFADEFRRFRSDLKSEKYDLIIDAQGLIKSALISWQGRGPRVGLDRKSIKEKVSCLFYNRTITVPKSMHAVWRVRQLFAAALGYNFDAESIDYGIRPAKRETDDSSPALMFLHGTTWSSKHWPLPYWRELARLAGEHDFRVDLPWGNLAEQERALAIAEHQPHVRVLERAGLSELAAQIAGCAGVVAVDTGLGHLAAAFNCPTVSIYGATDTALTGTFGHNQLHLKSDLPCAPCLKRECHYKGQLLSDSTALDGEFRVEPPCYRSSPPAEVMRHLTRLMEQSASMEPAL